jgi:hypothetical protein
MLDEDMTGGDLNFDAMEPAPPSEAELLEARVVLALERVPEVVIPEAFAKRVAGMVPARREIAVKTTRYGRNAAIVSMAVLMVAVLLIARGAAHESVVRMTLEWVLCGQLLVLGVGVGLRRWNLR